MSRSLRAALGGAAAVAALAVAAPALAAYTPRLVASGGGSETTLRLSWPDADDPTAKITVYLPAPYTLATPAVGAQIGTARAVLIAKELGNTKVALSGTVAVSDPSAPANRRLALACTGRAALQEQIWMLTLSVGGSGQNPIQLPAFVNRTAGPEAALGAVKLEICFRSPDIPPAQGGQPLGGKPTEAELTVRNVLNPPTASGDYLWRGIFTPYRPGTGTPNPAGTVESQSVVRVPRAVSLRARVLVRKRTVRGKRRSIAFVRLSGRVTEGGTPLGGVSVQLFRAGKRVKRVETNEDGAFVTTLRLRRTAVFRARATARERTTSCQGTPAVPTCIGATVSSFRVQSAGVRVRKPRLVAKRRGR